MAKAKEQEVEVLTAEMVDEIDTDITSALVKENLTEKLLGDLDRNYAGLTISGQEDKEGYSRVLEARKHVKSIRVLIKKTCEFGRAKANAESQKWIDTQKQLTARISPLEDKLEAMENAWESERDRLKKEKAQAEENRRMARVSELVGFGAKFEDGKWVLRDLDYEDPIIREADEEVYGVIREQYKAIFDENERVRKEKEEKEEKEREEMAKMRKERRGNRLDALRLLGMTIGPDALTMEGFGMHFNDTHMEMILDGDSDYWADQLEKIKSRIAQWKEEEKERIACEQKEKEEREKQERIALLRGQVLAKRQDQLIELGLKWVSSAQSYEGFATSISKNTLEDVSSERWEDVLAEATLSVNFKKEQQNKEAEEKRQQELKEAEELAKGKERLRLLDTYHFNIEKPGMTSVAAPSPTVSALGKMEDEEFSELLGKRKKNFEWSMQEQNRITKERQLIEASDKQKFDEILKHLAATPKLEFKSKKYREQAGFIYDFLDGLK